MMKKRIRRIKRKTGAVLFAVICVMALLIAMASTAYYTARSAYNSVVSNYNYSQLYLSAISVADMVSESVSNDFVAGASASNDYKALRDAIYTLETPGASIKAHSTNITNPSATEQAIINELGNQESAVAGALDGVVVEISLANDPFGVNGGGGDFMPVTPNPQPLGGGKYCYWYRFVYSFKTTAYYRGNTITVEDIVVTSKSRIWTPDPGSPGSEGSPAIPGTDPIPGGGGGNGGSFSTFFTATGQKISDVDGKPDIDRASRVVTIKVHEISDDAYFQNDHTFFPSGNNNTFLGGVTSTGSVYLDKMSFNVPDKDLNADPPVANDWFIGEDLVLTGNIDSFDIGNNNLYVGRDLVLGRSGGSQVDITAGDIYVEGDLYVLCGTKINGNLHVSGDIYYVMGDTVVDDGVERSSALANAELGNNPNSFNVPSTNGNFAGCWKGISGTLELGPDSEVIFPDGQENAEQSMTVGTQKVTLKDGTTSGNSGGTIGEYNSKETQVEVVNRVTDTENDEFTTEVSKPTSVESALNSQAGNIVEYGNYTTNSTAYENELNIDFNNMKGMNPDEEGKFEYYEKKITVDGQEITIKTAGDNKNSIGNCTEVIVTIPYNSDGYIVDIDADSINLFGNPTIKYEFETGEDPMTVVLKDNIEVDGEKAFSWQGNAHGEGDATASNVIAKGDGNLVFEMGNYNTETNKYEAYNPDNYTKYESVTYVVGDKEAVGNQAQVDSLVANSYYLKGTVDGWYEDGSQPKDEYQNQIMFVSNANNTVAVDTTNKQGAICGYIYAPNGVMENRGNAETNPVYGGMIVSTYDSELSYLYYAEPKPSAIEDMLGGLINLTPGGENNNKTPDIPGTPEIPGTPGTPPTDPPGTGKWSSSTPADFWNVEGSNFVG